MTRLPTIVENGRLIGHGQQLAAARLAAASRPCPEGRVTRQQLRHGPEPRDRLMPASVAGARPRKSRGPTGFDFSKCDPRRHLNSSTGKRMWRAKRAAK